jgi:hypothetical protein
VANQAISPTNAKSILLGKPWLYVGLSKSAWDRLEPQGLTPAPVSLPGVERRWRVVDLDRWVATLKTSRRQARRKQQDAPSVS